MKTSCLLGAHFSISKGLHEAVYTAKSYNCNALQLFTKNASTWKERDLSRKEIDLFEKAKDETGINLIASHTSYLINLASPETKKHTMSCKALKKELVRSSRLGIPYIVLHPGSHMGSGEKEGISRITDSINEIFMETGGVNTRLLLETTAGQGSSLGHTFEQLSFILGGVKNKDRIGVCLDTCHIFAAGYDIRTKNSYNQTFDTFHSIIGLKNLYLIHFNDSKKSLGSRVDRHEHIGEGLIGIKSFEYFMKDERLSHIAKIIETPKEKEGKVWDKVNLKLLRGLCNK
jgi:deoxyribonuclease-4